MNKEMKQAERFQWTVTIAMHLALSVPWVLVLVY